MHLLYHLDEAGKRIYTLKKRTIGKTTTSSAHPARFSPDVDVVEDPSGWTITLEVPGVPRDALHVDVDGTRLTLRGEK